jgi:hypothetical protein
MPANTTAGAIAIVRQVTAQAAFAFSKNDTYAFLTEIPGSDVGTTVTLPGNPSSGETYEVRDEDGSCGASSPIVVEPGAPLSGPAATVNGASAQTLTAAFVRGTYTYSAAENNWSAIVSTNASIVERATQSAFVWRQGSGLSGPYVFDTFGEAVAACKLLDGAPCTIFVDNSITASPTVPAGAYTGVGPISFVSTAPVTVTFEDGASIDEMPIGLLLITFASVSDAPVCTIGVGVSEQLYYVEGGIGSTGSAAFLLVAGNLAVLGVENSFNAGAMEVTGFASVTSLASAVFDDAFSGSGDVFLGYDASSFIEFTQTVASFTTFRLTETAELAPSIGATAARPAGALVTAGQQYFDTTLNAGAGLPIWRNATNTGWENAAGVPV